MSEYADQNQALLKQQIILFVEDDEFNRAVVTEFLQRLVGTLLVADDGRQGLALFRLHRPRIVLTDLQMPDMDGLTMAEMILAEDPSVLMIALTASDETPYLNKSVEIGFQAYITKPVSGLQLREILLRCAQCLSTDSGQQPLSTLQLTSQPDIPAATGRAALPVFDRAATLQRLGNDKEVLQTLLETYHRTMPSIIITLDELLFFGDNQQELITQVHTFKGASANIGAEALRSVATRLEKAAIAGDLVAMQALLTQLQEEYARFAAATGHELLPATAGIVPQDC